MNHFPHQSCVPLGLTLVGLGAVLLLSGCGGGGSSDPVALAPPSTPPPSAPPPSSNAANYALTITSIGQAQSDSAIFQANIVSTPAAQTAASSHYELTLNTTEASAVTQ